MQPQNASTKGSRPSTRMIVSSRAWRRPFAGVPGPQRALAQPEVRQAPFIRFAGDEVDAHATVAAAASRAWVSVGSGGMSFGKEGAPQRFRCEHAECDHAMDGACAG